MMWLRRVILFSSIFSLIIGLILGLSRSNFWEILQSISQHHFLIMSGSFFGTLITLERIVTIKHKWTHFLPLLNGSSIVFFLLGNEELAVFMLFVGAFVMLIMYSMFWWQHRDIIHSLFVLSGICYGIAIFYAYRSDLSSSVRFFELFFLITIVAERLELARFINVPEYFKKGLLLSILVLMVVSFYYKWNEIYGVVISLMALGLIQYDIAKKNIQSKEPHRFRGWALMIGYYWLFIHGVSFLIPNVLTYDIQIHTFFLGFVMNMVFAHVTIILPAVLKIQYNVNTKVYYIIWVLFQIVLLYRFITYRFFFQSIFFFNLCECDCGCVVFCCKYYLLNKKQSGKK
ncbi:MAG: hypothetical protein KatS3mg027_2128 [Bacteroidia bacterium]|nr:MAG: hypothetical protein KatS3mg027_2128 [Bacteroidia bacterium]